MKSVTDFFRNLFPGKEETEERERTKMSERFKKLGEYLRTLRKHPQVEHYLKDLNSDKK